MNSTDVKREWAQRSGEFSPAYYAYYGPNETSDVIRCILEQFLDRAAPVLELGCSSGRHLSHLFDHGFETLTGIDVNDDAFDVMEETYPELAASGEFYHGTIEDQIGEFDDDQFQAVYSVETLQHVHPDAEWVFDELSRITADLLVTVENEGGPDRTGSTDDVNYVNDDFPLYYRDWNEIFTDRGFVEVDVTSDKQDTIRTFRATSSRSGR